MGHLFGGLRWHFSFRLDSRKIFSSSALAYASRKRSLFLSGHQLDFFLKAGISEKSPSSWCPDKNRDLFLEAYFSLKEKCHRNLTKEEQKALEDLRSYDDIVIKQADKGLTVVVIT